MSPDQNRHEVLALARLAPMFLQQLKDRFHVHERLHETDPAAFAAIAPRLRAIAGTGESRITEELMASMPALRVISVMGVGYDGVDVAAAVRRGIQVTHTPDVLNDEVADTAIGLMLCAARQLPAADRYVRAGQWLNGAMPLQRRVSCSRLGIVGMGRIGKAIAHRAEAFGMSIAYTARGPKPDLAYRYYDDAASLAAQSDFLVVITPGGAGTRKLIDASVLKALGSKGYLINVARGSVVDQSALIEALRDGVIAGAGLDVFEDEPRVPQELIDMPHVVLTPHIGSATRETRQAMCDLAVGNLQAFFDGQPLHTPVPECR